MVKHTWKISLLLFGIFTVILQIESIYINKRIPNTIYPSPDAWWIIGKLSSKSKPTLSPKDVPGFSLTEDEMKKFNIWPDGFIPYYIDVTSFSDKVLRDKIRSFLNTVNSMASLNFIELPSPPEDDTTRWVFFINRKGLLGCADHSVWNFTSVGVQRVVLGYDCMNKEGELPEAVLAIAGVPAQHTAPNRDEYIEVFVDNVIPDKRKLFEKLTDSDWLFHDLPYDYDSVGHYHNFKYSMNGKTVIQPRNLDITIGETKELSEIDIVKLRLLYNFIAQKKQPNVPECQKLFKAGSKFNSFVPGQIIIKAKRKPMKYLGVQANKTNDVEYIDDEETFSEKPIDDKEASAEKQLTENNENHGTDDYSEDLSAEQAHGDAIIINLSGSTENSNQQLKSNDTKNIQKLKSVKKNKPMKNRGEDLLDALSDNHSGEIKILKLKAEAEDPLEYLSDYESDEEEGKKDRIAKEKHETLKYLG